MGSILSRHLLVAALLALTAAGPATTTVGGHTYRFPPEAFQGGMVETGQVNAVLLEVKWPKLEGLSFADQLRPAGSGTLLILGNPVNHAGNGAGPQSDLDDVLHQIIAATVARYGQQAFPLRPKLVRSPQEAVPGGTMHAVEVDAEPGQNPDAFVSPTIGMPNELISCSSVRDVPYPRCSQYFISHSLRLKVSYERGLVGQWPLIHDAVVNLFTIHEVAR